MRCLYSYLVILSSSLYKGEHLSWNQKYLSFSHLEEVEVLLLEVGEYAVVPHHLHLQEHRALPQQRLRWLAKASIDLRYSEEDVLEDFFYYFLYSEQKLRLLCQHRVFILSHRHENTEYNESTESKFSSATRLDLIRMRMRSSLVDFNIPVFLSWISLNGRQKNVAKLYSTPITGVLVEAYSNI